MKDRRKNLIQEVLESISSLKGTLQHRPDPMFKDQGFGLPHFKMMLKMAATEEGVSVSELSRLMEITPAAVTQFVDKLVQKGLVERFEDEKDRRVVRIKLTPSAHKKFKVLKLHYYEKMSGLFKNLSDKELEELAAILKKICVGQVDFNKHELHKKWHEIKKDIK